jgi:hypothetical protein
MGRKPLKPTRICRRCGEEVASGNGMCRDCNVEVHARDHDEEYIAQRAANRADNYAASNLLIARQIEWMEQNDLLPDGRRSDKQLPGRPSVSLLMDSGQHGYYHGSRQRSVPKDDL